MPDRNKKINPCLARLGPVGAVTIWLVFVMAMWVPVSVAVEGVLSAKNAFEMATRQEIILIDIRSEKEWQKTGVASVARPISMHGPQFLEQFKSVSKEANGRPIALICATGGRSAWLKKELSIRGMRNVIDVAEGMLGSAAGQGWIREGLPVVPYVKNSASQNAGEPSFWEKITGWYKPLWLKTK